MPRYAFYQEVRVVRPSLQNRALAGRVGVILGRADTPGQPVGYGITFAGEEQIWCCDESELEATGRHFRREDFYDDRQRIRVRVDDQGRGEPV